MKKIKYSVLTMLLSIYFLFCGCTHSYVRFLIIENKLKPTPYNTPTHNPKPKTWKNDKITFSLIGHSTVLLNFYGTTILTDPVLLKRISPPELWNNYFGIRRIMKIPLKIEELPVIDIVLISHAHFDHLCIPSLRKIYSIQKKQPVIIVPRDTKYLIEKIGFNEIYELHWTKDTGRKSLKVNDIDIMAFQVEHRYRIRYGNRDKARYCNGYSLVLGKKKILFIGDSAYRQYRDENRKRLTVPVKINWKERTGYDSAGFNLCILPIGDYSYKVNHMSPQDAIYLLNEIGGKKMLPVHYNTFIMTDPSQENPKIILLDLLKNDVDCVSFETPDNKVLFPDIGVECILD